MRHVSGVICTQFPSRLPSCLFVGAGGAGVAPMWNPIREDRQYMSMATTTTSEPSVLEATEGIDSDGVLLARSVDDPTAFEQVYERHHDAVFRYAAARIGLGGAEDLTAETFTAAFDARRRFDRSHGDHALPWLLGIATRRIGRHRDDERRWLRDRASAVAALEPARGDEGREARVDAGRLAPRLSDALAQLTRRERDPLLLHVLSGLAYEEVATALDLPIGTVRSRISRARTRLAGILDGVER
jgi:RNA polymerase sigma-70 factor (ECF subfamily)